MPETEVLCDQTDCKFNENGQCVNDQIELDYTGTCRSYEPR
jgi:hypothetical protein